MNRDPDTTFAALEAELLAESAASLGRAGTRLERAVAALAACPPTRGDGGPLRVELLDAAAAAAYAFVVQREALGMRDSVTALDVYEVPEEVRLRMGRQVAAPPEPPPEDPVAYFERLRLSTERR